MPLLIPANNFVFHFRSDVAGSDWGYRIAVHEKRLREEDIQQLMPLAGKGGAQVATLVLESEHPYVNSQKLFTPVSIPGAVAYIITFDERSCMEGDVEYRYRLFFYFLRFRYENMEKENTVIFLIF